jgi:hypothetical protein
MRNVMKMVGAAVLGIVVVVAILVLLLFVQLNSKSTACFGIFSSGDAAGRAAAAGRDAGFDTEHEPRGSQSSVTFTTGESGDDADELRRAFAGIVERQRGTLGHPGDGCLERTPLS